jgi:hypothetical protein
MVLLSKGSGANGKGFVDDRKIYDDVLKRISEAVIMSCCPPGALAKLGKYIYLNFF